MNEKLKRHLENRASLDKLAEWLWETTSSQTPKEMYDELLAEGIDPSVTITRVKDLINTLLRNNDLSTNKSNDKKITAKNYLESIHVEKQTRGDLLKALQSTELLAARKQDIPLDQMSNEQLQEIYSELYLAKKLDQFFNDGRDAC